MKKNVIGNEEKCNRKCRKMEQEMQKNVIGNAENVIGNAEQCNRKCRKCNRKCRKMEQEMQKNVIGNAEKCNGDKPFNGTAMNKLSKNEMKQYNMQIQVIGNQAPGSMVTKTLWLNVHIRL